MPEYTYPGVYIEERPGAPAPIQGASASTLALIGWTEKGPINDPVLVTGFKEFERKFGGFTADSLVPTTLHAFFKNGGNIARIVRVAPSDAAAAKAYISEESQTATIGTGDSAATTFSGALDNPVEPGSLSITDGSETFTDDGAGTLTGSAGGSGTIDYDTGDVEVTFFAAPGVVAIVATFSKVLWEVDIQWPGAEGNSYSLRIMGTAGQEDDATASYNLWTLQVLYDGVVVEQFDNLEMVDSTNADFFPNVVNDERSGSDIITVTDVGNTGVPSQLSGDAVSGEVAAAGDGSATEFSFTLAEGSCYPTSLTISYTNVSDVAKSVTDDGNGTLEGDVSASASSTIDYETGVVTVTFEDAPKNSTNITVSYYSQGEESVDDDFADGVDGSALTSSDIISASLEADMKGLYALNKTDDLLMVVTPDFAGDEVVDQAVLDYCTSRMDRFAILTTTEGMEYSEAVTYKRRTLARNTTSYGAIYWPWVQILDPVTEKAINIPPVGHVAGIYARTDSTKNVGKAPAGAQDGSLRFLLGLAQSPTKAQVGVLNRGNVNALVDWPQVGTPAVWGARTLESNGEFRYIQARRLFMFLEKSIYNATHIYVFENNGSALWARIRLQLGGFLFNLFQQGYFAGDTPEESYFVIVDDTNNPQTSIDAGELYVDVGVAPNKPAEFIVFRFQQKIPG